MCLATLLGQVSHNDGIKRKALASSDLKKFSRKHTLTHTHIYTHAWEARTHTSLLTHTHTHTCVCCSDTSGWYARWCCWLARLCFVLWCGLRLAPGVCVGWDGGLPPRPLLERLEGLGSTRGMWWPPLASSSQAQV